LAVAGVVPMTLLQLRTRREEANLIREFGDEYRAYQARTKRFIPFAY
jgi:protein-S-isoprenylcysteine O-methyltransferase Ste14